MINTIRQARSMQFQRLVSIQAFILRVKPLNLLHIFSMNLIHQITSRLRIIFIRNTTNRSSFDHCDIEVSRLNDAKFITPKDRSWNRKSIQKQPQSFAAFESPKPLMLA